jgi:hypothetical protein
MGGGACEVHRWPMGDWFRATPIWLLGLLLLVATLACAIAASRFNRWYAKKSTPSLTDAQEGYVVTSVYALLGLLVAFTFNVAVERYQARRQLVIEDANAIQSLYLKAQLLDEPHRSRFSELMIRYAENHLQLAQARNDDADARQLVAQDNVLIRDIWTATIPAFQSIKTIDFSTSFVDAANDLVKVDNNRKTARQLQIPTTIIVVLILYSLVAAAVLGAAMKTRKGEQISFGLLILNVLALMLVVDINRPVDGTIHESQEPMERTLAQMKANPPAVYQRLAQPPR